MKKSLTIGSLKGYSTKSKEAGNGKILEKEFSEAVLKQQKNLDANKIYLIQQGRAYSIHPEPDMTLLDSALKQGNELDFKCKKGTCGRCKVLLLKGASSLSEPNEQEKKKLDSQVAQGLRLACQSRLK
ncbi:2Fe-2S iron-sulfur cluster-binding protein [Pseudalkalibacillus salsuginis]|uniref:2Fe-2S iron-sulfur cluster-binding protein n=1 Tax=Pseudalkalibacillus salsuginis TaxID=2910972 RepID=UPI001F263C45|nr:2Fe-2S iron-sulfur cluster-binding protein [Pseudalkalibacillus salsuginis]MCF6408370.1 (2Fe-2S)-binding protein [Pseudalkalibacillus salsuginis]